MSRLYLLVAAFSVTFLAPATAFGQSLRGGSASLERQNREARAHDFTYIDTAERGRHFRDQGWLVTVRPNPDFVLHQVSFPIARPEVKLFVERLAKQYRTGCGEQMVVTSLFRPKNRQPRNASVRSVHPTGMAVDLRRPNNHCRTWLERVLLQLEGAGVIEATKENYPPHYHVAVFPRQYASYVERIEQRGSDEDVAAAPTYIVKRGDTLWGIAQRLRTTVDELRRLNYIRGSRIQAGQSLAVPRAPR